MTTERLIIEIEGEKLMLLPEKALLWERKKILLISDLHLGKSGHFRKAGIAMPSKIHDYDLQKLTSIISKHSIKTILIIGDLFHSSVNSEWKQFERWKAINSSIQIILVKGNHDFEDLSKLKDHGVDEIHSSIIIKPFNFVHNANDNAATEYYSITGHIHPAVKISGKGRQSIKLSCFWFRKTFAVLPSFGSFTGNAIIQPEKGDKIFVIMENKIAALQ